MNSYFILIITALIQYIMDPTLIMCDTIKSKMILLFHHFISIYIYIGGFIFNPKYHLLFVVFVISHWSLNNNRCEITIVTNQECGIDESNQFQDFLQTLHISKLYPNIHWLILPILGIVDIYKLTR